MTHKSTMQDPETTCSPIESAWKAYHGPIDAGDGELYIPAIPPVFTRGFVDGFDHGKSQSQSILRELCDAVKERLMDDPTPDRRIRCWNAWVAASEFLDNVKEHTTPRNKA